MSGSDENARDFSQRMARIEALVDAAQKLPDAARATTLELVQSLLAMHREALARVVDAMKARVDGLVILQELVRDDAVASVLLLHGLHPDDVETRVRRALADVLSRRPGLGALELVRVVGEAIHVRAEVGLSAADRALVDELVCDAAPEVTAVHVIEPRDGAPRLVLPVSR